MDVERQERLERPGPVPLQSCFLLESDFVIAAFRTLFFGLLLFDPLCGSDWRSLPLITTSNAVIGYSLH